MSSTFVSNHILLGILIIFTIKISILMKANQPNKQKETTPK